MKTININQLTGRFVAAKTVQEANLALVLRHMKDVVEVAKLSRAFVEIGANGKPVEKTTAMSSDEAKLARKALNNWKASQVEAAALTQELLTQGDTSVFALWSNYILHWDYLCKVTSSGVFTNNQLGVYMTINGASLLVKYTSKSASVNRWASMVEGLRLKSTPVDISITADTFNPKGGLSVIGRCMFKLGDVVYQYRHPRIELSTEAHHTQPIDLMSAIILAQVAGVETKTLEATPTMHFGAELFWDSKENFHRLVPKSPWFLVDADWGVTNGTKLEEGFANTYQAVSGWLVKQADGSFYSTEEGPKSVARVQKLHKEGQIDQTMQLSKVFVVNTGANEALIRALCTGVIWVPAKDLITYGQSRVVSTATKLGVKGTLAPVGFIANNLEIEGVTLMSFGSAKSNKFGLNSIRAVAGTLTANVLGEELELEGFWVDRLELIQTNQYFIQQYMPACLTTVVNSWAESNGLSLDKAIKALEIGKDNPAFVQKVKDKAEELGTTIVGAVKALVAEGEIKSKGTLTTFTPTEFDTMAIYHGRELAKQLADDLIDNKYNKDKPEEFAKVAEFLSESLKEGRKVRTLSMMQVFSIALDAMLLANASVNVLNSAAPSRAFLVHFVDGLYGTVGEDCPADFIRLVAPSGRFVNIPVGEFLEGATFKSSVFLDSVVPSGFLAKMLPYLELGVRNLLLNKEQGIVHPNIQEQTVANLEALYESVLLGKNTGRMDAVGGYHVLSVAPWADEVYKVYAPNAEKYKKGSNGSNVVVTKHPAIFNESHCGAEVVSDFEFYKGLVGDCMTEDTLKEVLEALGDTVFVHADMLLALQND